MSETETREPGLVEQARQDPYTQHIVGVMRDREVVPTLEAARSCREEAAEHLAELLGCTDDLGQVIVSYFEIERHIDEMGPKYGEA